MKQKYLLSVFLLAVGIALSSCKASQGELRSGKLVSRLPEGGWQLHEVWSLTEQGEKGKCLLGERIAITYEEMYTYPKVVAPKLVFEGSKVRNFSFFGFCKWQTDLVDQSAYKKATDTLVLEKCLGTFGLPVQYTVLQVEPDTLKCVAEVDSNKVCGIRYPFPHKGKALFVFRHAANDEVDEWKKDWNTRRTYFTPSRVKESDFHRVLRRGGWKRESRFFVSEDSIVGEDEAKHVWLGGPPPPPFAWQNERLWFYQVIRDQLDATLEVAKVTYSYDEDTGEWSMPWGNITKKETVLHLNDSAFSTIVYRYPELVDWYRKGGGWPIYIGEIHIYKHCPQEAVESWNKKWKVKVDN